jgi:2-hydroxychromene-2-carboxylate isomerase
VAERPVFYYDLNSPFSWLAAERVNQVLPEPPVWTPIAYGEGTPEGQREVERRARERGLLEVRWPEGWPRETHSLAALRAATFAAEIGKAAAFSLAAFRQQFNAGRPLSDTDTVLLAAAAAEIHPNALLPAIERQVVKDRLEEATNDAIARGVAGVPTVRVGDALFRGDDRLEDAAAAALSA